MSRPVRTPEIGELRAFCAAVDLGSLGRAARLLRVSQPGLSKRLRGLEALAGAELLERSSRGVRPTPAGAELYTEARKLLAQAEALEELLGGLSSSEQPVRLAASHTIAEFVLPGPLVEFERRPDRHLSVELLLGNSPVVRDLVRVGRADFGIAALDPDPVREDTLEEVVFCDDEVVVAVPVGHPWAREEEIPLDAFVSTPLIVRDPGAHTRRTVEAVTDAEGLSLAPPLAELGSTSVAKSSAVASGTPAVLSRLAVQHVTEGLLVRRVAGLRFKRRFALLIGGEETLRPTARALLEHLREHAARAAGCQPDAAELPRSEAVGAGA